MHLLRVLTAAVLVSSLSGCLGIAKQLVTDPNSNDTTPPEIMAQSNRFGWMVPPGPYDLVKFKYHTFQGWAVDHESGIKELRTNLELKVPCGGGTASQGGHHTDEFPAAPTGMVSKFGLSDRYPMKPSQWIETACDDPLGTCSGWFSVSAENYAGLTAVAHYKLECLECGALTQPCCPTDNSCEPSLACRGGQCCIPCTEAFCVPSAAGDCKEGHRSCTYTGSTCEPGTGGAEICNNCDDDGDTDIDEGLRKSCGVGPCAGGTSDCTAGVWSACSTNHLKKLEQCNGVDDDCDGTVDNNYASVDCPADYPGCPGLEVPGKTKCKDGTETCKEAEGVVVCTNLNASCGDQVCEAGDSSKCRPGHKCTLEPDCNPDDFSSCRYLCQENPNPSCGLPDCWFPEDRGNTCP